VENFNKATGEGQHGNHPSYNTEMGKRLGQATQDNPNATPSEAASVVRGLVKEVRGLIQNNPGTKINDLFKSIAPAAIPSVRDNTTVKPPIDRSDVQMPKTLPDGRPIY
jgi:hypothetical protein